MRGLNSNLHYDNGDGRVVSVKEHNKGLVIEIIDFNKEENDGENISTYYYIEEGKGEEDEKESYLHIWKSWATDNRWLDSEPVYPSELIDIASILNKWYEYENKKGEK